MTAEEAEAAKAKGNEALKAKKFDEAIKHYSTAISLDGSKVAYFSNRSAAHLSKGDATKALEDGESCIKLDAKWAKGYSRKGAALHELKRFDEAEKCYNIGLEECPGDAGLRDGLSSVMKAKSGGGGNPMAGMFGPDFIAKLAANPQTRSLVTDPAFQQKLNMIKSNPNMIGSMMNDPQMQMALSVGMGVNMMSPEQAAEQGAGGAEAPPPAPPPKKKEPEPEPEPEIELTPEEKAAKAVKDKALEAKARGNELYKAKNFAGALEAYAEALTVDPTNMTFLSNQAAVLMEMKDFDGCIAKCAEAIALGREHRADYADVAKAYVRHGKALTKKGDIAGALDQYRNAQVENFDKAIERLIKNTELDLKKKKAADYVSPEKAVEAKERGNEKFRAGDFPGAIAEYEEAVKRDPKNPAYYNNLAATLSKIGDFSGAKRECEKALDLDPKYVKAIAKKGDIEFLMKEYHKALESYKKGLAIEADNSLCKAGLQKTMAQINTKSASGEVDQERAAHGMADPEIQAILADPIVRNVINDLSGQGDQNAGQTALRDPIVAAKIEKLIAAGVLQTK